MSKLSFTRPDRVGTALAVVGLALVAGCGANSTPQSVAGPGKGPAPVGPAPSGYAPWAQAGSDSLRSSQSTNEGPQGPTVKWKANLGGNISQGPSVGADGTIYEANDAGVLHALNPATGADKWTFDSHGKIGGELSTTAAVLPDGTIVFPGGAHKVYGLSPAGAQLWSLDVGGTPLSPVIAAPDAFYVSTFSGALVAVKITAGKAEARWTLKLGKQSFGSPALRRDGVIEMTVDNSLVAIGDEGTKAKQLWRFTVGKAVEVSPAVSPTGITVLGTNDGFEYGIDAKGKQVWKARIGTNSFSSPAITKDGTAYFGDNKGVLTVVDVATGKVRASLMGEPGASDPGKIWTAPLIDSAGNVYYGTNHGQIFGFSAAGTQLLRVDTGKLISSYPALTATGDLLIGSNDGNVYSLGK
jgi:outer membrane protein assembly factor BamB